MNRRIRSCRAQRRSGAMLILVAIMLTLLLAFAAFAVDVAYMQLVRTQLRTATDAAAKAAAGTLARTQSIGDAEQAAINVAAQNSVAGSPLVLTAADIEFGRAEPNQHGSFTFISGSQGRNAARVTGRRTAGSPGGSVPLFLGGLLGKDSFEPVFTSSATGLVRDIALVLDRSGSMEGQKMTDLKTAVGLFLSILDDTSSEERVSLSSYSTTGSKDVHMTSDLTLITSAVEAYPATGFTAIGQGLQFGTDSLVSDANARPFAEKAIILMTDGIENREPFVDTVVPTAQLRDHVVFTISFGSDADQALMQQVALDTGGEHFHAADGDELRQVFLDIARTLAVTTIE